MKGWIKITANPLPMFWSYTQDDGHAHSGSVVEVARGYVAEPPPGGWPNCCPWLQSSINNELLSGEF